MASVVLARRGARVTAVDLSAGYVREAQLRADANGVELCCVQAEGERLPFADGSFARIWGNAILHHLDLERAGPELHRVLQPGGMRYSVNRGPAIRCSSLHAVIFPIPARNGPSTSGRLAGRSYSGCGNSLPMSRCRDISYWPCYGASFPGVGWTNVWKRGIGGC